MARVLVVYFSLTGHTKQIAEAIARSLGAELEPIVDTAGRSFTPSHMIWLAMEAILHQEPDIHPPRHDPEDYDLVVVGTPVWGGQVAPPVRTYDNRYKAQFRHLAVFCTEGGINGAHALKQLTDLAGFEPRAQLIVTEADLKSGDYTGKVDGFVGALNAARSAA